MELSIHKKISHDLIEWRSRLEGPDGLLLLLILLFLCSDEWSGERGAGVTMGDTGPLQNSR